MERHRRNASILASRRLLVVLFVVVALVGYNAVRVYLNARAYDAERANLLKKIADREQSIQDLKDHINMLQSGEGMELEARARLNLQRPDEHVLIILDEKKDKNDQDQAPKSWFENIKSWFN